MNAIPTRYAGVQFRSRLEARWAAMFDLLQWKWEYEPIDLDGYIPDFLVTPHEDPSVLVEVKPIVHWPCPVAGCVKCNTRDVEFRNTYDEAIEKIIHSGWNGPAFLVGASMLSAGCLGVCRIARLAKALVAGDSPDWIISKCRRCSAVFLAQDVCRDVEYEYRRWCQCCESEKAYGVEMDPTPLWREAGNRVQWRAPVGG